MNLGRMLSAPCPGVGMDRWQLLTPEHICSLPSLSYNRQES